MRTVALSLLLTLATLPAGSRDGSGEGRSAGSIEWRALPGESPSWFNQDAPPADLALLRYRPKAALTPSHCFLKSVLSGAQDESLSSASIPLPMRAA